MSAGTFSSKCQTRYAQSGDINNVRTLSRQHHHFFPFSGTYGPSSYSGILRGVRVALADIMLTGRASFTGKTDHRRNPLRQDEALLPRPLRRYDPSQRLLPQWRRRMCTILLQLQLQKCHGQLQARLLRRMHFRLWHPECVHLRHASPSFRNGLQVILRQQLSKSDCRECEQHSHKVYRRIREQRTVLLQLLAVIAKVEGHLRHNLRGAEKEHEELITRQELGNISPVIGGE